jgi:hypothetical protein
MTLGCERGSGLSGRVQPEHRNLAPVRGPQAFDAFHGGGLACAVGAENPEDLALLHGEGNIVHRHGLAVTLVRVLHFDHCWHALVLPASMPSASQRRAQARIA